MPQLYVIEHVLEVTQAKQILFLKTHCILFLYSSVAPPQGKLPVIDTLVIGVPCQPSVFHSKRPGKQIHIGCTLCHGLIGILVHILSFNNQLCAVLCQELKHWAKLVNAVGSGCGNECPVHYRMGNIGFQNTFRHVNRSGGWIAYQHHRTSGTDTHRFARRRKPDILSPLLIGRIILVLHRLVQKDLHTFDQAVEAHHWKQYPGHDSSKPHGPFSILILIKTRNTFHLTAQSNQPCCQASADIGRRCTLEAESLDLFIG